MLLVLGAGTWWLSDPAPRLYDSCDLVPDKPWWRWACDPAQNDNLAAGISERTSRSLWPDPTITGALPKSKSPPVPDQNIGMPEVQADYARAQEAVTPGVPAEADPAVPATEFRRQARPAEIPIPMVEAVPADEVARNVECAVLGCGSANTANATEPIRAEPRISSAGSGSNVQGLRDPPSPKTKVSSVRSPDKSETMSLPARHGVTGRRPGQAIAPLFAPGGREVMRSYRPNYARRMSIDGKAPALAYLLPEIRRNPSFPFGGSIFGGEGRVRDAIGQFGGMPAPSGTLGPALGRDQPDTDRGTRGTRSGLGGAQPSGDGSSMSGSAGRDTGGGTANGAQGSSGGRGDGSDRSGGDHGNHDGGGRGGGNGGRGRN